MVFTPTAAGRRNAALHVSNNDARFPVFDVSLGGTGVSASPFEAWISDAGVPLDMAGPQQSPFNDGLSNLQKFAFGLDPTAAEFRQMTVVAGQALGRPGDILLDGKLRMEFVRRKADTQPGLTYVAEFSSDLAAWTDLTAAATVTSIDATWERVVVDDSPPPDAGIRFGRVRVTPVP